MTIKNFDQLATTSLRKQCLLIADVGLAAVETPGVVRRQVHYDRGNDLLTISGENKPNDLHLVIAGHNKTEANGGIKNGTNTGTRKNAEKIDLRPFKRIVCIGFGKAALAAVTELYNIIGHRIDCGFVIDLRQGSVGNIVCRVGTHPHPTVVNVQATQELLTLLNTCTEEDLVLCVVSGGGSSLLCYPHELSCEAESSLIAALTVKGATIQEINTVRKHISKVKGGNLAKACYPTTVVSLIFSDVPGDDMSMVASGPTVRDTTTVHDASAVLNKYNVLEMCQMPACSLFETPKEDKYFEKVKNIMMVSGHTVLEACRRKADELGFSVSIYSNQVMGEAREVSATVAAMAAGAPMPARAVGAMAGGALMPAFTAGPALAPATVADKETKSLHKHSCLLGVGETTVTVRGTGKGGRNQEMALATLGALARLPDNTALPHLTASGRRSAPASLPANIALACVASDGQDNSDAAGAIVDASVVAKAAALHLDPQTYLDNNDSYHFFEQTGDLVFTGPTRANVADFFVMLKA